MGLAEALEHAVFMCRILIHNKLTDSAKEAKIDDSSSEFSKSSDDENNDTKDDTGDDYDMWE